MGGAVTVRLIHGDALDVLRELPRAAYALVTDPPYGIGHRSGRDGPYQDAEIANDRDGRCRDAALAWAVMHRAPWACFGTWKIRRPAGTRAVLVWDKGPASGMGDLSLPWKASWEEIYVGGDGWHGPRDEGILRGHNVVTWASKGRAHPNEKPVSLMRHLVAKLPAGLAVVDPFMGTGSTGVACVREGLDFVGVEIDPDYFAVASRRVAEAEACRDGRGVGELFARAGHRETS